MVRTDNVTIYALAEKCFSDRKGRRTTDGVMKAKGKMNTNKKREGEREWTNNELAL